MDSLVKSTIGYRRFELPTGPLSRRWT